MTIRNLLPRTNQEAIKLLATCEFKPFDKIDFQMFSGVQTKDPQICYLGDEETGMAVIREVLPGGRETYYFETGHASLEITLQSARSGIEEV